jgi:hypothetical protein
MSFEAKYSGGCKSEDCQYGDRRINPGDQVEFVDDDLMHSACAARGRRDNRIPRCESCGTNHRGECA